MSFANHGNEEMERDGWTNIYWFDLNKLPDSYEEDILAAELRIYKERATNVMVGSGLFEMKVYDKDAFTMNETTKQDHLLDSRTLGYVDEGKSVFDLTKYWSGVFYLVNYCAPTYGLKKVVQNNIILLITF
jgi:hypothetical protein